MENQNGYYNSNINNPPPAGYAPYNVYGGYNSAPRQTADPFINRETRHITKLSLLAGAALLAFVGMQNIMSLLLIKFGFYNLYESNFGFQMIFGALCSVICIFVPFIAVYGLYSKGDREKCFDFGKPVSKKAFGLAVGAGFMLCLLSDSVAAGFNSFVGGFGVSFTDIDMANPSNIPEFLLYTLECAVVPALVEEFAVRGVIMQPLRRYGDRFAIIMSAIIFALMHGNMMQIPFALPAGIVLGYFAIATGSIWTSVAIHFANNFFAVIASVAGSSSLANILFSGLCTVAVGFGIVCLFRFIRTEHKGLGLTAAPVTEKVFLIIFAALFIIISYFSSIVGKTIPLIYLGSAAGLTVFYCVYRRENKKLLPAVQLTGIPWKLLVSLYIASPTVILACYSLTLITANMVSFERAGSLVFCLLIFIIYFAAAIIAVRNVHKSELIENKKAYTFSAIVIGCLMFFTLIVMLFFFIGWKYG